MLTSLVLRRFLAPHSPALRTLEPVQALCLNLLIVAMVLGVPVMLGRWLQLPADPQWQQTMHLYETVLMFVFIGGYLLNTALGSLHHNVLQRSGRSVATLCTAVLAALGLAATLISGHWFALGVLLGWLAYDVLALGLWLTRLLLIPLWPLPYHGD
ncbi:hypothetical protein [uncultured Ferrimonas sp.]|uniref:hypothetical protein n=1 Tax=uncultured Ferrimonas sp. TaxID=432640 RepID=UPI0026206E49|nr:hypothetical protein [uncultured Ferrimonas sp.]